MSDNDNHEPAKGYTGMHIAKKLVAFPKLYMEKAIAEPVLDILDHDLGI